jgi:2-hydroxychromene-2-carboxylate isomerase|tara:strand:+ start:18661 stop:19305 length:645 start_codon:yes stop_codon:yes gene_type:complete
MKVDFYFSYRSPYSYFILPRLKKLEEEYKVQVNFKLVYPLAIREPHFFKNKNMLTYFFWRLLDYRKVAKKLDMKFYKPRPDPINQNLLTGKISSDQPYIFYVCHLGQAAHYHGEGLNFALALSNNIFGNKNGWYERALLDEICSSVGLGIEILENEMAEKEEKIIADIELNQKQQLAAGHHGVPLLVHNGKFFFGQDRFDDFLSFMLESGMQKK